MRDQRANTLCSLLITELQVKLELLGLARSKARFVI